MLAPVPRTTSSRPNPAILCPARHQKKMSQRNAGRAAFLILRVWCARAPQSLAVAGSLVDRLPPSSGSIGLRATARVFVPSSISFMRRSLRRGSAQGDASRAGIGARRDIRRTTALVAHVFYLPGAQTVEKAVVGLFARRMRPTSASAPVYTLPEVRG